MKSYNVKCCGHFILSADDRQIVLLSVYSRPGHAVKKTGFWIAFVFITKYLEYTEIFFQSFNIYFLLVQSLEPRLNLD